MIDQMSYGAAQMICLQCVCAACWSDLDYTQPDEHNANIAQVFCPRCKDATPGFISRRYAEWQLARNSEQFQEAKAALKDALPWLHLNHHFSEQENLVALGYKIGE